MTSATLRLVLFSSLMTGIAAPALKAQDLLPAQSPADFAAALRDTSTSPPFIAITVVNDSSGQTLSGCIPANLFLGAMHREYGLGYDPDSDQRVLAAALAAGDRVFHFQKDEAWANMPPRVWSARACQIIAGGKVARNEDRSGQVVAQAR